MGWDVPLVPAKSVWVIPPCFCRGCPTRAQKISWDVPQAYFFAGPLAPAQDKNAILGPISAPFCLLIGHSKSPIFRHTGHAYQSIFISWCFALAGLPGSMHIPGWLALTSGCTAKLPSLPFHCHTHFGSYQHSTGVFHSGIPLLYHSYCCSVSTCFGCICIPLFLCLCPHFGSYHHSGCSTTCASIPLLYQLRLYCCSGHCICSVGKTVHTSILAPL